MKFHIIIPTYNREKLLPRALDSILNQKNKENFDFHIYIIDDGSTDNTKKVVQKYLEKYSDKITYKYKENWWVWSARNVWIELALKNSRNTENDWVIFLDSDDELVNDAFEKIIKRIKEVKNLNNEKIKIIAFKAKNENWKETCFVRQDKQILDFQKMINWKYLWWEWAWILNLNIFKNKKYRFIEWINWWESLLWFRLYQKYLVYSTTTIIRIYYTNNNSLIRWKLDNKKIDNILKINQLNIEYFKGDMIRFNKKLLWIRYYNIARMYCLKWNRIKSFKYLLNWLKYNIFYYRWIIWYILNFLGVRK